MDKRGYSFSPKCEMSHVLSINFSRIRNFVNALVERHLNFREPSSDGARPSTSSESAMRREHEDRRFHCRC